MSQPEKLVSTCIVPGRQMFQVKTFGYGLQNVPQNTSHESEVCIINRSKYGNIVVLLSFHHVGWVLFVDQISSLFFDCKLNESHNLFVPYLLTVNVEEVLNVLDGPLEALDLISKLHEFSEHLPAHIWLSLVKYETLMQHLCQCSSQLLPYTVNEYLLGLNLDDTHEYLVEHQHTLSE